MRLPSRAGSRRSSRPRSGPRPPRRSRARCGSTPRPTVWTAPATAITSPAAPGATATTRRVATWPAAEIEVFAPCAAAALYRRAAFEEIGGFDERFFCYFEDVDLGFRLRLRGYRCLYVPDAIVRHVSSALSGYRSDFAVYHGERNAVWTFVKNMPGPLFWLYLPQHLALNVAALFYYPWRGQGRVVWRAKRDAILGLPAALRERRAVQQRRRRVASAPARDGARHHGAVRQPLRFPHWRQLLIAPRSSRSSELGRNRHARRECSSKPSGPSRERSTTTGRPWFTGASGCYTLGSFDDGQTRSHYGSSRVRTAPISPSCFSRKATRCTASCAAPARRTTGASTTCSTASPSIRPICSTSSR